MVSRLRSSFVSRLRDTAAVNLANASLDPRDIAASGQAVVAGLSSPDARAAALESLVLDASPQETIRQLVRLCEVRTGEGHSSEGGCRSCRRPYNSWCACAR